MESGCTGACGKTRDYTAAIRGLSCDGGPVSGCGGPEAGERYSGFSPIAPVRDEPWSALGWVLREKNKDVVTVSLINTELSFARGPAWKNRMALAPLTNGQSHADGRLSDEEFRWLLMRAQGGFALTMTCASSVHASGRAWAGQLAIESEAHVQSLTRLKQAIRATGSVSSMQLHHGGIRADRRLCGEVLGPSDHVKTGARALTLEEVVMIRDAFIAAAVRAEQAGFDGVELHAAHGYLLAQFLSRDYNHRDDDYGGDLAGRSRLLLEVIDGIRAKCGPDFQLGVRLSPERFGMQLDEIKILYSEIVQGGQVDYLDMSLWDVFKTPHDAPDSATRLLDHFTAIPRGQVRLGVAGKIMRAADVRAVLAAGCDFALLGKAAIVCHDFAQRAAVDAGFSAPGLPVKAEHLRAEGVSAGFVDYLRQMGGIVAA